MTFPRIFIAAALLITAGYLQFPILPEGVELLPKDFSALGLAIYLAFYATAFAPLIPLAMALLRGLTAFRLPRGPALLLAISAGVCGLIIALGGALISGTGAKMVLLHGITLTIAVCASIMLASTWPWEASEFHRQSWRNITLPMAVALWSLVSAGAVFLGTNRIAGDRPFCIALHTNQTEAIRSLAELRGLSFYTNMSGNKSTSEWDFRGLLIVDSVGGPEVYNWSPRYMHFYPVDNPERMITSAMKACVPRKDFWRTLSII
ncbi:hypothetical protein [uncultured Roseibium sp.]|uniref:hypothetical protein n=1 Tax=uncultured Roseibium sp. TaxID=1936171 RepID=UPI003217F594